MRQADQVLEDDSLLTLIQQEFSQRWQEKQDAGPAQHNRRGRVAPGPAETTSASIRLIRFHLLGHSASPVSSKAHGERVPLAA
jgi:hypothetical protein